MSIAASWYEPTIAAVAIVLAAVLPAWLTVHRRLGKPNGGGTVVGEITLVKEEAQKAASAATAAAASAQIAASAATTASISAQMAASMAEANGTKVDQLERKVQSIAHDIGLASHNPQEFTP